MIIQPAKALIDNEIRSSILNIKTDMLFNDKEAVNAYCDPPQFISSYLEWITSGGNFKIFGLDKLYPYITDGITDAFNNFHLMYSTRNAVVLPGEYPQHRRMGAMFLEDRERLGYMPIIPGIDRRSTAGPYSGSYYISNTRGKLIISYPFSATGTVPEGFEDLMNICSKRDIPVFLDCAFHGISKVKSIDVNDYDCIKFVGFSLSKTFATGMCRIGVCFTKEKLSAIPMCINTEWKYLNHVSMNLHTILMQQFSADYMYNKYRNEQVKVCSLLDVNPSDTIIFGITDNEKYSKFSRDDAINRLCISYLLQEDQID